MSSYRAHRPGEIGDCVKSVASILPCMQVNLSHGTHIMRIHTLVRTATAATFALCVVAGSAAAQGKGKDKDKSKHKDHNPAVVVVPVVVQRNGDVRRVPPGLAKKGGLPPGQAKKIHRASDGVVVLRDVFGRHGYTVVRTEPYGTSQYVYYRRGDGVIQRAVIVPGTTRLSFRNVPQSLLQEVLALLY